jgi:hypothetical protein
MPGFKKLYQWAKPLTKAAQKPHCLLPQPHGCPLTLWVLRTHQKLSTIGTKATYQVAISGSMEVIISRSGVEALSQRHLSLEIMAEGLE